jgi:hypothetical protein
LHPQAEERGLTRRQRWMFSLQNQQQTPRLTLRVLLSLPRRLISMITQIFLLVLAVKSILTYFSFNFTPVLDQAALFFFWILLFTVFFFFTVTGFSEE